MRFSRRRFLKASAAGAAFAWGRANGFAAGISSGSGAGQIAIPRIEAMPNIPRQFKVRDWRQVTLDLDAYIFDLDRKGPNMPLIWIDKSRVNFEEDAFGIYVTVSDPRCGPTENGGQFHDATCELPALVGATLVGIDKSNQYGRNWVSMAKAFFHKKDGRNVFMDLTTEFSYKVGGAFGIDFWYDTLPSLMFAQLYSLYPREAMFEELMRATSEQYCKAVAILKDDPLKFHHQTFNFATMKPYDGPKEMHWIEPDSSAAFAYQQMMAYARFGDAKYLQAAQCSLDALNAEMSSPIYDTLLPFGAYAAARMNAEHGTSYDAGKMVDWCFEGGSICIGGVSAAQWGDYDISGITTMHEDRPYLFETFMLASSLVPLTRYEPRLARAVGKWMLNAASNARLFYSGEIPDEYQIVPELKAISRNVIAYELLLGRSAKVYDPAEGALLDKHKGASFVAARDLWESWSPATGQKYVWPPASNFSLYSSTPVGVFGAIIARTGDENILQLDCLKTDYFHDAAYPTHLYFNPYADDREVRIDVGDKKVDLYDAVAKRWIKKGAAGKTAVRLMADTAAVIVQVPSGAKTERAGAKLLANGTVIDYRAGGTS
jgi:hypothetical protein